MKKQHIFISTILLITMFLFSCKKENAAEEEDIVVTISITEPTASDTFALYEEVHLEGMITANDEMHGYTISFINTSNNAVLSTTTMDVHSSFYNFHEHWINTITDTTIVKAKIDVIKDHYGNHQIKELNFVCLPQ